MAEISGFSDLLSQLDRYLQPVSNQEGQASAAESGKSVLPKLLPSDAPGSSFEAGRAVEDSGAYQPSTIQSGQRFGMAFSMQFNLSIQRETRVVTQDRAPGKQRAFVQAMEQTRRSYQSSMVASRNTAGSSFREMRSFQADLFHSRTRELSAHLGPEDAERMDSTSRSVVRTFELDISLEASFLTQFVDQSGAISGMDSGLFGQYLNNTDNLANSEEMQAFFNDVDKILEETEAFVQETLGSFFDEVAATFGLSAEEAGSLQSLVSDEVGAFFDDVDQILNETRSTLAGIESGPSLDALPEEVEGQTDPALI
jgi:hypothetical protein